MRHDGHTTSTASGAIRIEGEALAALVVTAAERVAGVRIRRPRRGLDVQVDGDRVRVALEVAARYGAALPELGRAVQLQVSGSLGRASGLTVEAVDVTVAELDL